MSSGPTESDDRTESPEGTPSLPDAATRDEYREALSYWASGVTIAAVRDGDDIQAMTVSSLTSVSDGPPTVLISLTGSARMLPYLEVGAALGISILSGNQRRVGAVFADTYPVGPSPFEPGGPAPLVAGALVQLSCRILDVLPIASSHVVVARVTRADLGQADDPLLYFRREFRTLE